jgi:hypothetical protein
LFGRRSARMAATLWWRRGGHPLGGQVGAQPRPLKPYSGSGRYLLPRSRTKTNGIVTTPAACIALIGARRTIQADRPKPAIVTTAGTTTRVNSQAATGAAGRAGPAQSVAPGRAAAMVLSRSAESALGGDGDHRGQAKNSRVITPAARRPLRDASQRRDPGHRVVITVHPCVPDKPPWFQGSLGWPRPRASRAGLRLTRPLQCVRRLEAGVANETADESDIRWRPRTGFATIAARSDRYTSLPRRWSGRTGQYRRPWSADPIGLFGPVDRRSTRPRCSAAASVPPAATQKATRVGMKRHPWALVPRVAFDVCDVRAR